MRCEGEIDLRAHVGGGVRDGDLFVPGGRQRACAVNHAAHREQPHVQRIGRFRSSDPQRGERDARGVPRLAGQDGIVNERDSQPLNAAYERVHVQRRLLANGAIVVRELEQMDLGLRRPEPEQAGQAEGIQFRRDAQVGDG